MRAIRRWLLSAALGAALTYFLDPARGTRRRAVARDRLRSRTRRLTHGARRRAQYLAGRAGAAVPHDPDNPDPDDRTLRDRVESEVFRGPGSPRERVNVQVVGGVVELRGELPGQGEIDELIDRVSTVRDVVGVRSYLHLPNTPAPNKVQAIEASNDAITRG